MIDGFCNKSNQEFSTPAKALLNNGPNFLPGLSNTSNLNSIVDECKAEVVSVVDKLNNTDVLLSCK